MSEHVLHTIGQAGIVAIVRLDDLSQAVELGQALLKGGIWALEFTLTNPDALQAIATARVSLPAVVEGQAVVGAGTVLTAEAARECVSAGAQFIVAPTFNLRTIEACLTLGVPIIPGAFSPTEILTAWEAGASIVKVFPARALGPNYIRDVLAPLPGLRLMPTGGVDLDNLGDYVRSGAFAVGVGGNLVNARRIALQDWDALTEYAREYVQAVAAAREKI